MNLSVIIPSFCGRELLLRYLPCILENLTGAYEFIVVDDASTDDSLDILAKNFPDVKVIALEKNLGFSGAVNSGIKSSGGDYILLLNNDVEISNNIIDMAMPLFNDENLFSVSPSIILPAYNDLDEGAKTGRWHHGLFYPGQDQDIKIVKNILYATGCAAFYRKSMLSELNGFDEAYSPYYWEDADLGYRAWKRGWKSLYQPECRVIHRHSASISKIKKHITDRIKIRNSLFFIWRNIEDSKLINLHKKWLPLVLAKHSISGDSVFINGWRDAYSRRNQAVLARKSDSVYRKLSDVEIFNMVGIAL